MDIIVFNLRPTDEYIELNKLLKIIGLAQTGGHAKIIIDEGVVLVNGKTELQKRKKLRDGDVVQCENRSIEVKSATTEETGNKNT